MSEQGREAFQAFPATQWSLVERACRDDEHDRRIALTLLFQRYLPALRAHLVISKRISNEHAEDLLQGFIADKIIEQNLLSCAQRDRGKFRSFLLVTLDRYAVSCHRAQTAAMRAPAEGLAELGDAAQQVTGGADPGEQFNLAWARELIAEALRRMQAECEQGQRPDLWTIFHGRVIRTAMNGEEATPYEQLVDELKLASPLQACSLLTTAKRMFQRNLRAAAQEYTGGDGDDGSDADSEIDELRAILSRGGAQSGRRPRN